MIALGHLEGIISIAPIGKNGFGYDPIFYMPHLQSTLAELNPLKKNNLSHRAKALAMLKTQWNQMIV